MENKKSKTSEHDRERWLPVPDEPYNKSFMVSNKGQIKNINTGNIKTLLLNDSTGYYAIRLDVGKKYKKITYQIHQLVAKMFLGECPDNHYVVHKDSNKENNSVSNLIYMSASNSRKRYLENKNVVKKSKDSSSSEFSSDSDSESESESELVKKVIPKKIIKQDSISESESGSKDKYCLLKDFKSLQEQFKSLQEQVKTLQQNNKPNIQKPEIQVEPVIEIPNNPNRKTIPDFKRYEIDKTGKVYIKGKDCIKQPFGLPSGYVRISLTADGDNSKLTKKFYVHRLVAEVWIPNPKNLPFINHINSNKQDNRVENLEWCTASQNMLHNSKSKGTGKRIYAFDSKTGKFYKSFESIKAAGREIGVDSTAITKVISGDRLLAGGYFWKKGDYDNEDDITDIDDELLEQAKKADRYRKKKIAPQKETKDDSSESESESDS
jgi:hypothetical protein